MTARWIPGLGDLPSPKAACRYLLRLVPGPIKAADAPYPPNWNPAYRVRNLAGTAQGRSYNAWANIETIQVNLHSLFLVRVCGTTVTPGRLVSLSAHATKQPLVALQDYPITGGHAQKTTKNTTCSLHGTKLHVKRSIVHPLRWQWPADGSPLNSIDVIKLR